MTNKGKDQLIEKLKELEANLTGFREGLESTPRDDDHGSPATPEGQTEKANTVAIHVTKESSSEITEKEIEALKRCARAKGLIVKAIDKNDEENQA